LNTPPSIIFLLFHRDDVLDELLTEREEVAAQRKALSGAVKTLQEAAKVGVGQGMAGPSHADCILPALVVYKHIPAALLP
jgi:hypothetical protein